jgi:hypothetical protein
VTVFVWVIVLVGAGVLVGVEGVVAAEAVGVDFVCVDALAVWLCVEAVSVFACVAAVAVPPLSEGRAAAFPGVGALPPVLVPLAAVAALVWAAPLAEPPEPHPASASRDRPSTPSRVNRRRGVVRPAGSSIDSV